MTSAKEGFMFGKGVYQEEENLLRDIIRSIDKKVDYTAKEGQGSRSCLSDRNAP
jgi:hypothetical protein